NLPVKNPESKRLNQGSKRIVLLPKVISQPSVPNHLKLTPAEPGPPLAPGVSAPSATPGSTRDVPQSIAAAVRPATSPAPRNRRRETPSARLDSDAESMKHMAVSAGSSDHALTRCTSSCLRTPSLPFTATSLPRSAP